MALGRHITTPRLVNSSKRDFGVDGKYHLHGMPHVTKIVRKPKGVGLELKALADCESGIMLRLEIQKGKAAMASKEYVIASILLV